MCKTTDFYIFERRRMGRLFWLDKLVEIISEIYKIYLLIRFWLKDIFILLKNKLMSI